MKFELIPCTAIALKDLRDFMKEVETVNEFCHPLLRAHENGIRKFLLDQAEEEKKESPKEYVLAFLIDDELAGVCRVTARLNHIESGKIGYYLRHSRRKNKYAPIMIRLIEDFCMQKGVTNITAVVDIKNTASMKALFSAGWTRTKNQYTWFDGRKAIEFRPLPSGK